MKILIVDDEKLLVKGLKYNFEQDGYIVECAYDGDDAIKMARDKSIDLIILDLMLPNVDGLSACQKFREFSYVPIVMLSAKTEDMDKILGLEYGADDYLTKPFNILELKARVKAILRRITHPDSQEAKDTVKVGAISLNYNFRRATVGDRIIDLTAKEFDILDLFISNPGRVYSRESLLDIVWGYEYPGDIRTVDVHVRRLREKIEPNPAEPTFIHTKWGVGYYYQED